MLCEKCKENEATIHYAEIVNGIRTEHHLCSRCAAELDLSGYSNMLNSDFPFVKLLTGLLASNGIQGQDTDNPMAHVICPQCGMNYEEFTRVGKFGCAGCFDVFGPLIEDNMKKLHGDIIHRGKKYINNNDKDEHTAVNDVRDESDSAVSEIEKLQIRLKEAVELENYEEAARCRDRIRELKK